VERQAKYFPKKRRNTDALDRSQDPTKRHRACVYFDFLSRGFVGGALRGRCFTEIDLMIRRWRPARGSGVLAFLSAAAMRPFNSGRSSAAADTSRRPWLANPVRTSVCGRSAGSTRHLVALKNFRPHPLPRSSPLGSGSAAPCKKKRFKPLAYAAREKMASRGLSLGP
jgi:hypothetical protein